MKLVFPLQRGKSRENFFNEFMVGSNPNEISRKKVGTRKRLNFGDWIQKTVKKDSQKRQSKKTVKKFMSPTSV